MTSPPSPPNRHRRRVVVTVVVLLVVGLCWRMWPRVDQRFVGRWSVEWADEDKLSDYSFDFDHSGFVTLHYDSGTRSPEHIWHSNGTNFRFGLPYRSLLLPFSEPIYAGLSRIRGRPVDETCGDFTIISASRDEIQWRSVPNGRVAVLRRLPE